MTNERKEQREAGVRKPYKAPAVMNQGSVTANTLGTEGESLEQHGGFAML